jgi:hypothetical protein
MTLSASAPIGHLIAGFLIDLIGVRTLLLGMATGVGVVAVLLAWMLTIHQLRKNIQTENVDISSEEVRSSAE